MKNSKKNWDYLFRPFQFIAGGKALIYGVLVMFALVGLCYLTDTVFDGALDSHYICEKSTILEQIYCVFGVYIIMVIIFYITALIVSGKNVRLIDIAGTFALAKTPLIPVALMGFWSLSKSLCGIDLTDFSPDAIQQMMFIVLKMSPMLIVSVAMLVWYIVLMYNGYSVSANVRGIKGVLTFIAALLVSEILSKVFLWAV
ncbi:MAG: hypothetical protein FWF72_00865, partial [Paludibacter sp.]|nr:hypothetical protein [Paludibacter sp.]